MSALDDAFRHQAALLARFGDEDLPDIGGNDVAARLAGYRKLLARVRADDGAGRALGVLGWDTLAFEELLEALTAPDNENRYAELVDLIGLLLCWADAVRRRNERR
jgi:hypothetical protein